MRLSLISLILLMGFGGQVGIAAEQNSNTKNFDFNRLAISASGRAYHPLLIGKWNKKDGTALGYEVKGEKFLAYKPVVSLRADGGIQVKATVGRFRPHVKDDTAVITLNCGKDGILKSAQVSMTLFKRPRFDSGSIVAKQGGNKKAAIKSVIAQLHGTLVKYLASTEARKGRKHLSVVVETYLKAMAESVKGS